jgi:AraC-like DNA-binding protein
VLDRELPAVLAFVTDAEWKAHIEQQLLGRARLGCLVGRDAEARRRGDAPDVVIVQLDAMTMSAADVVARSARIRSQFPNATLLAYCRIDASAASLLAIAARSGVDRVLIRGYDHLAKHVDQAIRSAGVEEIIGDVVERLKPLPERAREIAVHCMRRAFVTPLTVASLAGELQVHRRTLVYQLRTAGFPPPAGLIGWCRLLVSAHLLDHTDRTVSDIARELHFITPSHYRGTVVRYTGFTPTALRHRGALGTLVTSFTNVRDGSLPIRGRPLPTMRLGTR